MAFLDETGLTALVGHIKDEIAAISVSGGGGTSVDGSDYIVAEGTSDCWHFIKFANGLAILGLNYEGAATSYAGPYTGDFYGYTGDIAYPFAFKATPAGSYNVEVNFGFTMPAASTYGIDYTQTTTALRWFAFAHNNYGTMRVRVTGAFIGRWK